MNNESEASPPVPGAFGLHQLHQCLGLLHLDRHRNAGMAHPNKRPLDRRPCFFRTGVNPCRLKPKYRGPTKDKQVRSHSHLNRANAGPIRSSDEVYAAFRRSFPKKGMAHQAQQAHYRSPRIKVISLRFTEWWFAWCMQLLNRSKNS